MIKELEIINLYGKNYNLKFNEDLTILYGRNGSGKTTILNIIQLLLEGEIKKVCGFSFDILSMKIVINQKLNTLEITRNEDGYVIIFKGIKIIFKKINSNLNAIYQFRGTTDIIDDSSNEYSDYIGRDFKKLKLLSINDEDEIKGDEINRYLKKELSYIYIPLNRKVRKSNSGTIKGKMGFGVSNKRNIEDSLKMAESYFVDFKNHINRIENNIYNKMRTQIFDQLSQPIEYDKIGDFTKLNQSNFDGLEDQLGNVLGHELTGNIKQLYNTFNKTKDSYKEKGNKIEIINTKNFITHTFTVAQLNKLKNVIEATATKNQSLNNFKNTFQEVLENINMLFKETQKTIGFDNNNEKLFFSNENLNEKLEMSLLSSGEKQLVIFFIFSLIDYKSRQNSILLIDEPEVSLHIEWQERLLPSIMKNNSKKQIIIATHSPDIIGDYVDKCREVRGD